MQKNSNKKRIVFEKNDFFEGFKISCKMSCIPSVRLKAQNLLLQNTTHFFKNYQILPF